MKMAAITKFLASIMVQSHSRPIINIMVMIKVSNRKTISKINMYLAILQIAHQIIINTSNLTMTNDNNHFITIRLSPNLI